MTSQDMKEYRSRRKLSQKALATALGMHWRTIQEYEAGQPIPRVVELALQALEGEG